MNHIVDLINYHNCEGSGATVAKVGDDSDGNDDDNDNNSNDDEDDGDGDDESDDDDEFILRRQFDMNKLMICTV
jgi:hypothetical protein